MMYYSSQNTYPPRYYQRIAINRTLDAIAQGRDRLLLVMATGTGKTYTAFQIVYRLLQCGMKRKILYLVDRNFLADTSIQQDFAPLQKVIHKINYAKDDAKTISAYGSRDISLRLSICSFTSRNPRLLQNSTASARERKKTREKP